MDTSKAQTLQALVFENLSFFEAATLEELILSFDSATIEYHDQLTVDDLKAILLELVKQKKVQLGKNKKGQQTYQRILRPRTLRQYLKGYWQSLRAQVQAKLPKR